MSDRCESNTIATLTANTLGIGIDVGMLIDGEVACLQNQNVDIDIQRHKLMYTKT